MEEVNNVDKKLCNFHLQENVLRILQHHSSCDRDYDDIWVALMKGHVALMPDRHLLKFSTRSVRCCGKPWNSATGGVISDGEQDPQRLGQISHRRYDQAL